MYVPFHCTVITAIALPCLPKASKKPEPNETEDDETIEVRALLSNNLASFFHHSIRRLIARPVELAPNRELAFAAEFYRPFRLVPRDRSLADREHRRPFLDSAPRRRTKHSMPKRRHSHT